jgi:hypothetical protein
LIAFLQSVQGMDQVVDEDAWTALRQLVIRRWFQYEDCFFHPCPLLPTFSFPNATPKAGAWWIG